MKNTRKLIPALAMLLVSAVMMSTASFAWFTMNTQVEATGLQISAVAPASLWISQDDTEDWKTSVGLGNENTDAPDQFAPVTEKTTTAFDAWTFQELTGEASTKVELDGTIAEGDIEYKDEDSKSFYKDKILLKLQSTEGDTAPVKVQVKVTDLSAGATDAIYKAIHVAAVIDGEALEFDLGATTIGQLSAEQIFNAHIEAGEEVDPTEVVIYAWIDGPDTDCKNENALNIDTFKIDLVFTVGDIVKAGSNG